MSAMTRFTTARSLDEALDAVAGGARPVAGGTDLVVGARQGKAALPESLVAIHRVVALKGIGESNGSLSLGPLATHAEIAAHPVVRDRFTALADASAIVGSHATRAHGTLGGNLMNASPAMETGGPLMCLDATVTLRSATDNRTVAVGDLFAGPGMTAATPDELLVAIEVPPPAPGTGSAYVRLEYRRQMEIAVVGATAVVVLDGPTVTGAKVAITALAPTIRRVPEAEAAITGTNGDTHTVHAAARAAASAASPISDVRASERYRRAMAEVIARRAIDAALTRARGAHVPVPASSGGA